MYQPNASPSTSFFILHSRVSEKQTYIFSSCPHFLFLILIIVDAVVRVSLPLCPSSTSSPSSFFFLSPLGFSSFDNSRVSVKHLEQRTAFQRSTHFDYLPPPLLLFHVFYIYPLYSHSFLFFYPLPRSLVCLAALIFASFCLLLWFILL